jgi:hypothetical protein
MISSIKQKAVSLIQDSGADLLPEDCYTNMKYPKVLPVMRFRVDQYSLAGFGHIMIMHTATKMGMELITMSFMPSECVDLPYLLVDAMTMKKKRCVFVEYYGCGMESLTDNALQKVHDDYSSLPDYEEKENWYINERMPYSLIKTGETDELINMAADSIKAYLGSAANARNVPEYHGKLKEFRERMIVQGNPSSKTLNMLLKEDGARTFMETVIMPLKGD